MPEKWPSSHVLNQGFAFGAACSLYRGGIHPRLLFGPEGLELLGATTKRGDGARLLGGLRDKTAPLVASIEQADDLPLLLAEWRKTWNQPGTWMLQTLFDLAMVAVLDRAPRLVRAVEAVLCALPEAESRELTARRRGSGYGFDLPLAIPLAYDLLHEQLEPEAGRIYRDWAVRASILDPLRHQGGTYYLNAGANIPMHGMLNPLVTGLALKNDPGVPDLAADLAEGVRRLEASLRVCLGPEGFPTEDIGYGNAMVCRMIQVTEMVRRAGLWDAMAECPRLRQFGQALLHVVQPWGEWLSNTGDHSAMVRDHEFALARLAVENHDPTLLWLLGSLHHEGTSLHPRDRNPQFLRGFTTAREQRLPVSAWSLLILPEMAGARPPARLRPPPPTAFRDRGRALVTFRSSWKEDATMVLLDGSHRSPGVLGHCHASAGHFSLSALGEYFAIDTGRYNMEQDQHNVVLPEGQSGHSTEGQWRELLHGGHLEAWHPHGFCDYAAADYSLQAGSLWSRRHLGLVKGGDAPSWVWLVEDLYHRPERIIYQWTMNTSPENRIAVHARRAVVTGWRHGHHLDVHALRPGVLGKSGFFDKIRFYQDEKLGGSQAYVKDPRARAAEFNRPSDMVQASVYVRPRLCIEVEGDNGRFMTVLIPRRRGQRAARCKALKTLPNSMAVEIQFPDGVTDTFIWAYEHGLLEAGDILARGSWCVVRRDSRGRVLNHCLHEGTSLQVAGKYLCNSD